MNCKKNEKKFVLIKWLQENKFDVLDIQHVFLNDNDEEIEIDCHYKFKLKDGVFDGIVKFIGSEEKCEKEFKKISTYQQKQKGEKKPRNTVSENEKSSQSTSKKNQETKDLNKKTSYSVSKTEENLSIIETYKRQLLEKNDLIENLTKEKNEKDQVIQNLKNELDTLRLISGL